MTESWATRQGESFDTICSQMRWQADSMRAFSMGMPPPPLPAGMDMEKLMQQQQKAGAQPSPMAQVGAAQSVDSAPFTGKESAFDSPVVREEYESLCRAHSSTITLGEGYGNFDALGKLAYLDALEAVEDRWDVFYTRFALLGALNPTFKEQTDDFLSALGMDVTTFREVLREAHVLMREDAERERA